MGGMVYACQGGASHRIPCLMNEGPRHESTRTSGESGMGRDDRIMGSQEW